MNFESTKKTVTQTKKGRQAATFDLISSENVGLSVLTLLLKLRFLLTLSLLRPDFVQRVLRLLKMARSIVALLYGYTEGARAVFRLQVALLEGDIKVVTKAHFQLLRFITLNSLQMRVIFVALP